MPATYKGLTVPVSTDKADGPAAFRDYTDTLPASEALQAYNTGTAGAYRLFATLAEMNAWAAPNGSIASVVEDGNLYKRANAAWVRAIPDDPVVPSLPRGAIYYSNNLGQDTVAAGATVTIIDVALTGTLTKLRSAVVTFSCVFYETAPGNPTTVRIWHRVPIGASTHEQQAGVVPVVNTAVVFGNGIPWSGTTAVVLGVGGTARAQVRIENSGTEAALVYSQILKVAEI
jgi:hypothetical protein